MGICVAVVFVQAHDSRCPATAVHPADSADSVDDVYLALREDARYTLESNCGSCHLPGLSTSNDGALRVFNLSDQDWAAHMTPAQLQDAAGRLREAFGPGGPDGTPLDVPAEQRAAFDAYVAAELLRRNGCS